MYTETHKIDSTQDIFTEAELSSFRSLFPYLKNKTYINHAATGPLPTTVIQAVNDCLYQRSTGEIEYWPDALEAREEFKNRVGRLINASASSIAVSDSTSMALNWLTQGLTWKKGDRILLNDLEFPSNVNPFLALREKGVEIDFISAENGVLTPEAVEAAIRPETTVLSLSFVQFLNGFRSNLAEIGRICQKHGVIFCVDAIQGLGALQLDVQKMKIDFLACGGQKWLLWPRGTSFFYVSPTIFDKLAPMATGWLSVEDPWTFFTQDYKLLPDAGRFEPGIFNVLGVIGANAALQLLEDAAPARIEAQVLSHSQWLSEWLANAGYRLFSSATDASRSGIVTFYHHEAEKLLAFLQEKNMFVSMRDGKIRVSPHFYNIKEELIDFTKLLMEFDNA
ncbi:MAG: aminotransferase class V-fold PLP-dependent enzyme [Calditrichia bacterium]